MIASSQLANTSESFTMIGEMNLVYYFVIEEERNT